MLVERIKEPWKKSKKKGNSKGKETVALLERFKEIKDELIERHTLALLIHRSNYFITNVLSFSIASCISSLTQGYKYVFPIEVSKV